MSIFCLAQHASYRCQHAGACCNSNWPIHMEAERLPEVRAALGAGRLALPRDGEPARDPFVVPGHLPPGAGAVLRTIPPGACAFYDRHGRRCAIHRDLGPSSLPSACQHFPRRCVIERDETRVSLSHYCPTVALTAFAEARPRGIVRAPVALVSHLHLEGLDARDALPPLLRPGMLTDVEGYRAWERAVVEMLEQGDAPEAALARVRAMTERVRSWRPGGISLAGAVARASEGTGVPRTPHAPPAGDEARLRTAFEIARAAVPDGFRPAPLPAGIHSADLRLVAPEWGRFSRPLGRFLAAHAFANWMAYLGTGLDAIVRSLDVALSVVRVEAGRICEERQEPLTQAALLDAFRAADLLLVHLADPKALAFHTTITLGEAVMADTISLMSETRPTASASRILK